MKKVRLLFFLLVGLTNYSLAQCPGVHTDVCFYDSVFILHQAPTSCFPSGTCDISLAKGFIVISVEDSIVVDVVDGASGNFHFGKYDGCVTFLPICYDLIAIQNFVDALYNPVNFLCCSIVNSNAMGLCDSIMARYSSGSEIMGLNDLINVFGSDTLRAGSLQDALDSFNMNIGNLLPWCSGISVIQYCADSVDFINGSNIYEIDPFCSFPDCLDTMDISSVYLANDPHQSVFKATQIINIEGDITSTEMIELRAENEVILHPGFSTFSNAILEIAVEPCVPSPAPPRTDLKQRRQ